MKKIDKLDINIFFKKAYIQQISLRDFTVNSEDELIEKCREAYEELQILKNKTSLFFSKGFFGT